MEPSATCLWFMESDSSDPLSLDRITAADVTAPDGSIHRIRVKTPYPASVPSGTAGWRKTLLAFKKATAAVAGEAYKLGLEHGAK